MFWNKHKQRLKDKEAGLVFNWRDIFSLKYPFFLFLILSLILHFFFFRIFKLSQEDTNPSLRHRGTLYLIKDDNNKVTQKFLSTIRNLAPYNSLRTQQLDPLSKGIDQQLGIRLNAGLFDWDPTPLPYPAQGITKESHLKSNGQEKLPPINTALIGPLVSKKNSLEGETTASIHISLSQSLADRLFPYRPEWKNKEQLYAINESYFLTISPEGEILLITPKKANKQEKDIPISAAERWIRTLKWSQSSQTTQGVITIEGSDALND